MVAHDSGGCCMVSQMSSATVNEKKSCAAFTQHVSMALVLLRGTRLLVPETPVGTMASMKAIAHSLWHWRSRW